MEAKSMARGRAIGTRVAAIYQINSKITVVSSPFPIILSNCLNRNWSSNTNSAIENVSNKGPWKDFITRISSFFTLEF